MFRSTLFWCLIFLSVLGLESAIVWTTIPEEDRPLITDCIINSNRLEVVNPTPSSVPSEQSTPLSKKKRRNAKHKQMELDKPPKVTPLAQFTIEDAPGCRLVVSSYEAKGKFAHFFSAIVFDGNSGHVSRLGSIWNTYNQIRVALKEDDAKSQAEHYFLWTPYRCKENWQEVDQTAEKIKVKNEDYILKWVWTVDMNYMVGTYSGPATGPKQFSKYIFGIGQQLNTANAKLVTTSAPASLAEIEADIEKTLSGVHPFLTKQWSNAGQLETQLGKDATALTTLTSLVASETGVVAKNMFLDGAKVLTTGKGLICIFRVQPDAGQESYYVLAGGLLDDDDRCEMTMYINMGSVDVDVIFEKCDVLVENHYTLAFNPSIMPTTSYCQWPWKHTKHPAEYLVSYETIKKEIADSGPYPVNFEEIYVQKIKTWNYDSLLDNYKIAAYVIFGYKGRFFTAVLQRSRFSKQWSSFHVGGLMFAEHLRKEINRYHEENYENPQSGISRDILSKKVFPRIQSELPNITGWKKSQIPEKITEDWVVSQGKVVAPPTARNASVPNEWYYYIFKITENEVETQDEDEEGFISSKFFTIIVVNKEDVIIVEAEGRKSWYKAAVATTKFREFLKKEHANALSEL